MTDATRRKLARHARIRDLVGDGIRLDDLYGTIKREFGVNAKTIRRDFRAVGKELKEKYESEEHLGLEMEGVVERMTARAADPKQLEDPKMRAVAQRADEMLLRFLKGSLSDFRLRQLGHQIEKHTATVADLKEQQLEAKVDLAKAEATLARTRASNVKRPFVVILGDIAGELSSKDLAAMSPTFATEPTEEQG